MTTALIEPATAREPVAREHDVSGRLSFDGVLRGEWIKLLSLRSIRWSIIITIVLSWGGAALMASAMAGTEFATLEAMPELLVQSATLSSMFTVLVMGILGVLAVTSEYASGLILSSLAAVPSRTPLLGAKALVVAALGLAVGGLSTFGGGLISATILGSGAFEALVEPTVLISLLGATLFLTLSALLSLGLGALLRSSAGAIAVMVTLLFISTIVFQILTMTGWEWVPTFAQWMPADLGHALSTWAVTDPEYRGDVSYWAALGGLAAWAVAALVPAGILLKTRDAA
ncbi:ABC transporter permease subunit [Leucobacter soli]|uniref:ABC-2 type transport system permease protein n=1 Tax=Leucobacter soli TaxID=2812850 RepID=A0A916JRW3_9MICO|nr:ABC transporter permease [Leucobacter soli]CAG7598446.1 hypothetical protein LEUCIP111803_00225 [Leucobacter soli]